MEKYGIGLEYVNEEVIEMISYDSAKDYFDFDVIIGNLNLHTIDCVKVLPNKNWSVAEHFHTFFELHIIPKGRGSITIDGSKFEVKPRQFYLTGPYVNHSQISDAENPMEEFCLKFEVNALNSSNRNSAYSPKEIILLKEILSRTYPFSFEDVFEIRSKFEQLFIEAKMQEIGYKLKIQLLITDILVDVLRTVSGMSGAIPKYAHIQKSIQQERIDRIAAFVSAHYMDEISIHSLVQLLFLSPRQINRIMVAAFNMTFHEYLLCKRFEAAKRLIEETSHTLEEISFLSGFSSPHHLYQVMKRFNYKNPRVMRKAGEHQHS